MKLLLGVLMLSVSLSITAQTGSFTLSGNLNGAAPEGKVYLEYREGKEWVRDSAQPTDNKYRFSRELREPKLANLSIALPDGSVSGRKRVFVQVFLDVGQITVNHADSFANPQVSGSKAHDHYMELLRQARPYLNQRNSLAETYREARKAGDKEGMESIEKQLEEVDRELRNRVYGAFLREYPASPVSMYALQQFAGYDIEPGKVEPLFNNLHPAIRAYPSAEEFREKIEVAKRTAVGQPAIEFTQNDTLGNPVSLSAFRGKYLLIDFWASWCGPCRQENPNLVKAFETYSNKGFHVLGVSLDRPNAREKWLKAIHDDQLNWTHVSDLKFWENEVARIYGINAIPQNLLVDPSGKIIARNLRGQELQDKLKEIFN